jgi:glutamine cyclotransferase
MSNDGRMKAKSGRVTPRPYILFGGTIITQPRTWVRVGMACCYNAGNHLANTKGTCTMPNPSRQLLRHFGQITLLLMLIMGTGLLSAQEQPEVIIPEILVPEVLNTYPHDSEAFTQGLLWHEGVFYESTGLFGESSLRRVDIETGEVLDIYMLPASDETLPNGGNEYFGEGLARVDDRLIQLTWQAGEAFVYDIETFELLETYRYEGEGWGLCYDDRYLFLSDGSPYISVREADDFSLIVKFMVTFQGAPIEAGLLNELECVGDDLYANLWQTNLIVRIDKFTGVITHIIETSDLLTDEERANYQAGRQVLNGIAYNPESDTFFITGKEWNTMYEVRFVPYGD